MTLEAGSFTLCDYDIEESFICPHEKMPSVLHRVKLVIGGLVVKSWVENSERNVINHGNQPHSKCWLVNNRDEVVIASERCKFSHD
ncbi:hypothetical protein HYFRA_00001198 [Hymenoscyphus fraxineus]|uniref:Uncharacterized protein n=1 Tax=Hymenoscyphus fraxineus TaxID=746836 RepID=A0A9N9KRZ9_9HELO|nr:hypothetical protein HYFRA_00001198 [Hymenoscyphus fraxineus]